MDISVEHQDNTFRVTTQVFSFQWPDTSANRKVAVVFLRGLRDAQGQELFTFQQLAALVDSPNRQAASHHLEEFRACGEEFKGWVTRKRKVDAGVVEAVRQEIVRDPLVETEELGRRVNARLRREDLSAANLEAALEQISCREVRRVLRKQLAKGEVHYQEEYLLEEMLRTFSGEAGQRAGIEGPPALEGEVSDPPAMRKLITPGVGVEEVPLALRLVVLCLTLYFWGVPLSRLGRWLGVHKTTVLRWMLGLVGALWPYVGQWIQQGIRSGVVYVDEKWIKIRGKWHYWFVALEAATEIPLCTYLSPRRSGWACRWMGAKLRRLGIKLKAVGTDGLAGYGAMMAMLPGVVHQVCLFHHQKGVTTWVREHLGKSEEGEACKKKMKRVFQTGSKRTVRRRLEKLEKQGETLGIGGWVQQTRQRLGVLVPAVGSRLVPRTINGLERFFRTFNRFYKVRCGFHSVRSAQWELLLFVLVYLFTQREKDGKAPLEAILPEVAQMPLYRLLNDPLGLVLGIRDVKQIPKMADAMAQAALAA